MNRETILRRACAITLAAAISFVLMLPAARAQSGNGLQFVPLGFCQMAAETATRITPANCTRASFTATGTGTSLAATAVTGRINIGDFLAGTGVPSTTYIASQISGTPNGAGTYLTSNPTTSVAASLTAGGVPRGATHLSIVAETQAIRFRDDNQAPTATVGMPLAVGLLPYVYSGSLANIQFITQTSGAVIDLSFSK